MSKITEDLCVDCGLPCIGHACPYHKSHNSENYYCDTCLLSCAEYKIEGEDFCNECARAYLGDIFNDLTILEQAKLLKIDISKIGGI